MEWSPGTFFKSASLPFTYNWITWQYFDRNKDYLKIWSGYYGICMGGGAEGGWDEWGLVLVSDAIDYTIDRLKHTKCL